MSLFLRVWLPIGLIIAFVIGLCGALYLAFDEQAAYREIEGRTTLIFRNSNRLLSELKDAETGQRGFILTGDEAYLAPFNQAVVDIPVTDKALHELVAIDPSFADQLNQLDNDIAHKLAELDETVLLRRTEGFDAAMKVVRTNVGQQVMDDARQAVLQISSAQKEKMQKWAAKQTRLQGWLKLVILVSAPIICLVAFGVTWLASRRLLSSLKRLEAGFTNLGGSGKADHIDITGKDEFARLAGSFNMMAARLTAARIAADRADQMLRENNDRLIARGTELEQRTAALDTLGRIAHRLPGCADETEFAELIQRYIPQLFEGVPGALYLLNASHTLLRRAAMWLDPKATPTEFTPNDCWAMRRGQPHVNLDMGREIVCKHFDSTQSDAYMCWPLTAHNETVGVLYLEHVTGTPFIVHERHNDINVLAETIALALVNLRLRETLRNQSIRDALTGLFNRRYLEESLELEINRAERTKAAVAVIMIDVDHFKLFNDTFGHAAGDLVLKQVASVLTNCIRKGDVACRYGGEEFLLVLVGANVQAALGRAEQVRASIKMLDLHYNDRQLGNLTVSLGVAVYPESGTSPAPLIAAADAALYRAKRGGRDQVLAADAAVDVIDAE